MKILLAEICNRNFGDAVIAHNVKYLLNRIIKEEDMDNVIFIEYDLNLGDAEQVKYVDAVIFVGGGIVKYLYEEFDYRIEELLSIAEKYSIPCYFNAVGVEGYSSENERCQKLKQAINQSCVKGISIRDDYKLFKDKFLENNSIRVTSVFDSAIYSSESFCVQREEENEIIGLGIAREGLFLDNGIDFADREFLLDFWKSVIESLEQKDIKWKLFTNGLESDERFAEDILKSIGHGEKMPTPCCAEELIMNISSFKAIIACRMHANIIAYSLKIPSVGLIWNNKLALWGEKCGYSDRFIKAEDMNGSYAVDKIVQAMREGCKGPGLKEKEGVYQELKWFVSNYCKLKRGITEKIDYHKYMMAAALGNKNGIYRNMNTTDTIPDAIEDGFYFLAADIRKTQDDCWVCVNGWDKNSYKKLGMQQNLQEYLPLRLKDFKQCKYYGFFQTRTFEELVQFVSDRIENQSISIFINSGNCILQERDLDEFVKICEKFNFSQKRILIKLQSEVSIEYARKISEFSIVYEPLNAQELSVDAYVSKCKSLCENYCIEYVGVSSRKDNALKIVEKLREENRKPIVYSYMKTKDLIACINAGAELVGSYVFSVDYLESLTH